MSKDNILIREITKRDNEAIAELIRKVLIEYGVPKVGSAYEDTSLGDMTASYSDLKSIYYVVEINGKIFGGSGIAPLKNAQDNICELQKMYFLPEARGKGIGKSMMKVCLNKAKALGYEKCYLETLPYMKAAIKLYTKTGFKPLKKPLGNTGHYSCNVWMIKDL